MTNTKRSNEPFACLDAVPNGSTDVASQYAKYAAASGRRPAHGEITWVQKQLGHSSITLTVDTYGAWARKAEKAQAKKLARAFPV